MKLLRVHVISAKTCGGLLDGLDLWLRSPSTEYAAFDPLCFVGANGSGKSQLLQVLAEILQSAFHACVSNEERSEGNPDLLFEVEYLIRPSASSEPVRVRISRQAAGRRRPAIGVQRMEQDAWTDCNLTAPETAALLPKKVVGYTSGDNETLSLPFLVSRSAYADEVGRRALDDATRHQPIADTRLMLIDYGTHLEVLVANLLLGDAAQREALLEDAGLHDLHSYRCIIQLAHRAAPTAPRDSGKRRQRKGVQLTDELEGYLDNLKRCATCYTYDDRSETYVFDYWVSDQTKAAFRFFWGNTLDLYSSFHKLAMLNDLAIPKKTRERFRRDTNERRFASRLPEPQDEDKVFRFERVCFTAHQGGGVVDYVSLSDGEHQLGQLLGTLCMLSLPGVLFLLDEPESHFNPQWRVRCISRILDLPTVNGKRRVSESRGGAVEQESLLTTHSPFVPSDMSREKVFIFAKERGTVAVRHPDIETYGTTFDTILEECFGIRPPISNVPLEEIEQLKSSDDPERIRAAMDRLGHSVEKVFLADRVRQLTEREAS
jgi:restriction system-associated AAA family ATPase